jgi:hypothetical protein
MAASIIIISIGRLRNKEGTYEEQPRNKHGTNAQQNLARTESGNPQAEPKGWYLSKK